MDLLQDQETKHGQDMLCICKKLDILANEIKNISAKIKLSQLAPK